MYLNLNGAESNGFEVFVHNANQELNNKYLKSTIHIFTSVEVDHITAEKTIYSSLHLTST